MLPFLGPRKNTPSSLRDSRIKESAVSTVILILLSGLLTTSVAHQHTDRRDSDVDQMHASATRADSAAEDRHPDIPYISSSTAACGRTLLESFGTFASPHSVAIRQTADANDRQQGSEIPAQQKSGEAIIEGAGKSQRLSPLNVLPSHRQSEMASSDSATADPMSCQWRIAAAREERIRLEFTHVGMVSTASDPSHCIEEYVEVRDGYHSGSPLMVDCGGHLKANQGIITSPGYPREYPPNANCTWLIEVPFGFSVVLTFKSFELEGQMNCPYDYVEVFDGPSESSPVLLKICGLDVPPSIQSTHNTMAVRFVTDDVYQDNGFAARFERTNCGGYLKAREGTFTSPGYPVEYPPNSKCTWRIEIPVGFSVSLSFDSFKVEEKFDCAYDHLEIYDGPSEHSPSLRRLCGTEIPAPLEGEMDCPYDYVEIYDGPSVSSRAFGKICGTDVPSPIRSTQNTMTVRFVADDAGQYRGFAARFKKESNGRGRQ
ncbi:Bone morphoproteintic protein 1 [Sparganum proliferum]